MNWNQKMLWHFSLLLVVGCGGGAQWADGGWQALESEGVDAGAWDAGETGQGDAGRQEDPQDGGFNPDAACAVVSSQATLVKKPVDVVFVIDNSGSMTEEIAGVEKNINQNFAQLIGNSGLDYRVVLLSLHGDSAAQRICISAPLSGTPSCQPVPAQPKNGARFFHYSAEVASKNSLRKLLDTYQAADPLGLAPQGWSGWLRPGAFRVLVEITDDNQSATTDADIFESELFALPGKPFGTAAQRNYRFHSIIGVKAKPNPAEPYLPTEPVMPNRCTTAGNTGRVYQELSMRTGGLRFPVCETDKYDVVFQTIAKGVVAGAEAQCEFDLPLPPAGYNLSNRLYVEYRSGTHSPTQFQQVRDANGCGPQRFYVQGQQVRLCPETCSAVQADPNAKVAVLFTCEPGIN